MPDGTAVGIDVGGTKLLAVRVDAAETFAAAPQSASPRSGDDLVEEVLAAARRVGGPAVASVGVGVAGLVDGSGTVVFAPHLPGTVGTELGSALRAAHPGTRLWIGNDATAACWAEHRRGAGAGGADMLMVTLGTGIGGGLVSGGRLIEGVNRFAGEFGHMVVDPAGPPCPCGKRGCWERFASGSGLGRLAREHALAGQAPALVAMVGGDPEGVKGEHVTAAAASRQPEAVAIMREFGWWVALGLANLVNLFDPEVVVLGGGLVEAGEILLEPTRRAFSDLVEAGRARPPVRILGAALGPHAGAVGSALLAATEGPGDNAAGWPGTAK